MPARRNARVLLVEDDDLIRAAVEGAFEDAGYVVRSEAGGEAVRGIVGYFRPDIVVLDARLSDGPDGLTLARQIRTASDLPILFLTAADAVSDRLAGFDAGADDYLVKPFDMAELLARSQGLLRRAGRLTSPVWQVGDLVIDEAARAVVRGDKRIHLTATEYDLLCVLVRHAGQVLSQSQLLAQVWDFTSISTNSLTVHMSSLRRKLDEHGPRLIHTVRRGGYVVRA